MRWWFVRFVPIRERAEKIGAQMIGSKRAADSRGEVGERFDAIIASSGLASRKANPKVMASGIGIVVVGALLGALVFGSGRDSHRILVAARPIDAGAVLAAEDVRAVEVSGTPAFRSTPPNQLSSIVGRVTTGPIAQGSVVTLEQFRVRQSAPEGSALLAVVLEPGALPTPDLRFGDQVDVMVSSSPNAVIDEPARIVTRASVWRVWGGTDGGVRRAVTLAVPEAMVPEVGDAASRNLIRLVVVPTVDPPDATTQQWPDIAARVPASADTTVAP
jgi:hypothetical protein